MFVDERDFNERRTSTWWHQALGVVICTVLMLLLWFLATLNPKKEPPTFEFAFFLAVLCGIFAVYLIPWMIRLCPSWIGLTEKELRIVRGNTGRSLKWQDVEFFNFAEERDFPILRLELRKGGELEIGLDASVQANEVGRFLRDVGVLPGRREHCIDRKPDHNPS